MPGDFRCDRGDYARVLFYFAREAAGASSARHSLRPLLLGAANQFLQTSGASRRGIAVSYLDYGEFTPRRPSVKRMPDFPLRGCDVSEAIGSCRFIAAFQSAQARPARSFREERR